ncbi:MAG: Transposase [Candidatus Daviesbacteria bacterium GW2011_GWB1_36_5]|uniref:Transposase n=1 Tax=Candidatus Daviesbacteria bacterium GW2011_GWB1_36_5 TaxID=1618426 RepID=A0A0G0HD14_9BACT|nr:MAG: Transposase [Candidatus Daviesbacteria bacterium GW2011_GWB1_36_5]
MQKKDLNPFRNYLILRIKKGVTNGKKLFHELQNQGFNGSYITLYRYLKEDLSDFWTKSSCKKTFPYKTQVKLNRAKYKTARIIDKTEPGKQAQVDWAHFGEVTINHKAEKLYCFVYILSFSRAIYIEFTTTQKLSVFETCHINAFKALGIPEEIVYDNTKTVIISNKKLPDGTRKINFNLGFLDFANFYGFLHLPIGQEIKAKLKQS